MNLVARRVEERGTCRDIAAGGNIPVASFPGQLPPMRPGNEAGGNSN